MLAISITTITFESVFITDDHFLDSYQSSLTLKTVETLTYTQYWLHLDQFGLLTINDTKSYRLELGKFIILIYKLQFNYNFIGKIIYIILTTFRHRC